MDFSYSHHSATNFVSVNQAFRYDNSIDYSFYQCAAIESMDSVSSHCRDKMCEKH